MRSNLPQATKTKKLSSLPEDLLSIAEELIASKFGIEEEVVEQQAPASFCPHPGCSNGVGCRRHTTIDGGQAEVYAQQDIRDFGARGYRESEIYYERSWGGRNVATIRVVDPSEACIINTLRTIDAQNIRGDRTFIMSRRFFNTMMREPRIYREMQCIDRSMSYNVGQVIGRIFGCNVVINEGVMDCQLRVVF